jgi:hypothetical protein
VGKSCHIQSPNADTRTHCHGKGCALSLSSCHTENTWLVGDCECFLLPSGYMYPLPDLDSALRNLAAVDRTCRTFHGPAPDHFDILRKAGINRHPLHVFLCEVTSAQNLVIRCFSGARCWQNPGPGRYSIQTVKEIWNSLFGKEGIRWPAKSAMEDDIF